MGKLGLTFANSKREKESFVNKNVNKIQVTDRDSSRGVKGREGRSLGPTSDINRRVMNPRLVIRLIDLLDIATSSIDRLPSSVSSRAFWSFSATTKASTKP